MSKRGRRWAACLVAAGACAAAVQANTLAPGGAASGFGGVTLAADAELAGKVVEDVTQGFRYPGWYSSADGGANAMRHGDVTGTLQSRVVLARDGTYDFYWRVSVDSKAFLPVAGFTVGAFPAGVYDANWRSDDHQGQVPPAVAYEAASGQIDWRFGQYLPPSSEIYPGQRSYLVFLRSGARHYTRDAFLSLLSERDSGGSMGVDWGGSSALYPTFAPSDGPAAGGTRTGAAAAIAAELLRHDPFLSGLAGHRKGCIVSNVAHQQARFLAYGPRGGPYDRAAIGAAVASLASSCR